MKHLDESLLNNENFENINESALMYLVQNDFKNGFRDLRLNKIFPVSDINKVSCECRYRLFGNFLTITNVIRKMISNETINLDAFYNFVVSQKMADPAKKWAGMDDDDKEWFLSENTRVGVMSVAPIIENVPLKFSTYFYAPWCGKWMSAKDWTDEFVKAVAKY